MNITTVYVFPPLPVRSFDWCAFDSDGDESGPYGWGKTEQEALGDLKEHLLAEEPHEKPAEPNASCGCRRCNPRAWWMIVCSECGNKRCPHAEDHDYICTGSNEPGQIGTTVEGLAS